MTVGGKRAKPEILSKAARADRDWERQCGDMARFASEWLWETDTDLRISYLSDRLRWIMDVDPTFFIGKKREEFVDESGNEAELLAHLDDLRARRPIRNFVYDVDTPSGRRYVRIDGDPVYDAHGRFLGYRGIGRQVTERVEAEQKAAMSFRQLVDAVENLPVGLVQYDPDDRLLFWNGNYLRLYPELASVLEVGTPFRDVLRRLGESGAVTGSVGRVEDWLEEMAGTRGKGRVAEERLLSNGTCVLISDYVTSGGGTLSVHTDITALKLRETELSETAKYLKTAARIANLGTWDWDPETNILRNSEQTLRICGLQPEHAAVDNDFLMAMIHPEDREGVVNVMRTTLDTGEPYTNEYRITRPDGEVRIFLEMAEKFVDELSGKQRLHGTIQDITVRRRREEQLIQSQRLFELAFQQSPGMTAISEVESGKHIAVNDKWVEIMGWPREEAIGKTAFEMEVWVDLETRARAIDLLRKKGRFKDLDGQYRTRAGEVRDFLISAEKIEIDGKDHMLITGHDITERKRAERELRNSEARLSGILRIAPEAVIVADGKQTITLFNDGAERMFGYSASEVLGKQIDFLIPPGLRDRHRHHVDEFRDSPEASRFMGVRQEISALRKDGSVFPAEASISKLELQGETVFTVLLHDITDRKKAERLLLAAKDQAESASRAKSEFLANMSHELRTPLNAILGFSEVIRSQVLGPVGVDKYLEYAEDIHRSGEHLLEIISDILDVARIDAGHVKLDEEFVTIKELVDSSVHLVRERAERNRLDITMRLPQHIPPVFCDRRKMKQVIINLLSNAVKFTDEAGSIAVAAWLEDSGGLVLEVSDTGIGMAREDVARVMEPFAQVGSSMTRHYEGTGLGLPLVKKLLELHGGSIDMETAPGEGTRVRVRLPALRVSAGSEQRSLFGNGG